MPRADQVVEPTGVQAVVQRIRRSWVIEIVSNELDDVARENRVVGGLVLSVVGMSFSHLACQEIKPWHNLLTLDAL